MRVFVLLISMLAVLVVPGQALAHHGKTTTTSQAEPTAPQSGGAEYGTEPAAIPQLEVPGDKAVLMKDGYAAAPANAPLQVKQAVWAANRLQDKPYRYGGGHAKIDDTGFDCSGTISYALHYANLLKTPLNSSGFMSWGRRGKGEWITVYTNPGHAFVVIAGLRLDTSAYRDRSGKGPRWRRTSRPLRGYRVRHPAGF